METPTRLESNDEMYDRHMCGLIVCADGTRLNGRGRGHNCVRDEPRWKYINRGGAKFGTNPGGKYVYSGSGAKFRTNPGGKYRWYGNSP